MPSRGLRVFCAIASPPGMEISTSTSIGPPTLRAASSRLSRIIWRGTGLMAGSPGGRGRPARVTVPTPVAGPERHAGSRRAGADGRDHQGAMGHVRIVARILDDAGPRAALAGFGDGKGEGRPRAARKRDLDGVGKIAGAPAADRPPWPPPWRRRRWSSRGAAVRRVYSRPCALYIRPDEFNSHLGAAGHGRRSA